MKLIAGLGNPGKIYARHRHNVGFRVVDLLGKRHGIELKKRSFGAEIGNGMIGRQAVILAKPQTFMNISGDAVGPVVRFYRLEPNDLIVIHDDLDIELSHMKISMGQGHGGHNGVRSVADALGSTEFFRVRVGIGRPPVGVDATDYVLSEFDKEGDRLASDAVTRAADAVEILIEKGLAAAQQAFH